MFRIADKIRRWKIGALSVTITGAIVVLFQNCSQTYFQSHGIFGESSNDLVNPHETPIINSSNEIEEANHSAILASREYIAAILLEAFGPNKKSIIASQIVNQSLYFGGPCSLYTRYRSFNSSNSLIIEPEAPICSLDLISHPLRTQPTVLRQGTMLQVCSSLLEDRSSLEFALKKIESSASLTNKLYPQPTLEHFKTLHQLFYRDRPLPPQNVFESFKLFFSSTASTQLESGWKNAIYSYCISSQWQVL